MGDKFQVNFDVIRLYDENNIPPEVIKVGILPFVPASNPKHWQVMVMKPQAEAKHMGAPAFQIAKGTRRICVNDTWCDMREDDLRHADASFLEQLLDTALREGQEEVGLRPSNISRIYDMGGFVFTSASKGIQKPLHMFAAEVLNTKDFDSYESSTAEVQWMTQEKFATLGRADHAKILNTIVEKLMAASTQKP